MVLDMQWQLAWFLAVWLFSFGACVGSFLNVVIYRLPRGRQLARPNSCCPKCEHPIRWHDNLPILGWMMLGGHCRDCQAPISRRYPFVELLMGAMFLCLGVFEGLTLGMNLPMVLSSLSTCWLVYGCHMLLLSVLVAAAFIQFDRQTPPPSLFLFASAVALGAMVLEPAMVPHSEWGFHGSGLLAMLGGAAMGAVIGAVASFPDTRNERDVSTILMWLLVGQFLGWQAVCWIAVLTTLLVAFRGGFRGSLHRMPTAGLVVGVIVPWILSWGVIVAAWPGLTAQADASLAAVAVMFALAQGLLQHRQQARHRQIASLA